MSITKEVLDQHLAELNSNSCRDKATLLLREGKAAEAAKWFSKAISRSPADSSLFSARSMAWETAGRGTLAVSDAAVGVCMRPRVAAGFIRLSSALESQGRYKEAVRACFLGMRCGDSRCNGILGSSMARVRELGSLPPVEWTPVSQRERWVWRLLSVRGLILRFLERAGRWTGLSIAARIAAGGDNFMHPPWPGA
ncbi:unnamed protein product [Choristocarpus tenellus]